MSFLKKLKCGLQRRHKSKRSSQMFQESANPSSNITDNLSINLQSSHSFSAIEADSVGTSTVNSSFTNTDFVFSNQPRNGQSEVIGGEINSVSIPIDEDQVLTTELDIAIVNEGKKSAQPLSEEDIWSFICDPGKTNLPTIYAVLESLRRHNFSALYKDYGYNKAIIVFAVIYNSLSGIISGEDGVLLSTYMMLSERRLQDTGFFHLFESRTSQILSMKKQLNTILKDKTSNSFICVECQKNTVSILFLPCGHIIVCDGCHKDKGGVCRSCDATILESHHVYF